MRLITFVPLLILTLSCSSTKYGTTTSSNLNGTWVPIKEEIGGKSLPAVAFQSQKLLISDSIYIFSAESVDQGVVTHTDEHMDIYGKDGVNAGKHFTAKYKLENEQLTICYNLKGDGYPESFESKSKPTLFLCVFKKETMK
jgi:uncharacterized protein (TIGR03067 family)